MNIKFLVSMSGSAFTVAPGDTLHVDKAEAVRLIEAGFAVPVTEPVETAMTEAPEKRKRK